MIKFKKVFAVLTASLMLTQVVFGAVSDLQGHWAKDTINKLMARNVVAGYSDGTVRPDNYITRAEFIVSANKLFDISNNSSVNFNDLKSSDWYFNDVSAAYNAGYISGYKDGSVKPVNYITRQEAACMVQKLMRLKENNAGAQKFKDYNYIADWAKGAVGSSVSAGVINGYTDGTFNGSKNITRAEAFTMLEKAYEYKNEPSVSSQPAANHTSSVRVYSESAASNYSMPTTVSNFNDWRRALRFAVYNLYDSVTIKIEGFDSNIYDLGKIDVVDASIKAEGTIRNNTVTATYYFDYKDNYVIMRAVEDSRFMSKLNQNQINVINKAKTIASEITNSNMTDYEKEKAIHDYLILNYKYDSQNGTIPSTSHTIEGFFNTGTGVCEAYANAFNLIGLLSGLDCAVQTGKMGAVNHAWNIVKIQGNYYHIDVTSDDPIPDEAGRIMYSYFNLSDSEISKTHTWTDKNAVCSSMDYNYFVYNNLMFTTRDAMEQYVLEQLKSRKAIIEVYTKGFAINGADDFKFIYKAGNVSSFELKGEFGKEGAVTLKPVYK